MSFQVMMEQLAGGLMKSISIFLLTLLFALPLGLLVSFGRMSRTRIIRSIVWVFISVLRGTPLMLQLLAVYFGPFYLFQIKTGDIHLGPFDYRFIATIIGFSLNYAAYFAEIFRGGIQSMSKGQYEAAQVLGFTKSQTYFRIILPQVIKTVLPSVSNEVITLVKDTSLAQVLSVSEMFTEAKTLASANVSVIPYIAAGVFYYIMNGVIEMIMTRIEKSMSYYS